MILAAGLSELYWECAQVYSNQIYGRTVRPYRESNKLRIPDDLYYEVLTDMQHFLSFGCKAYINFAKETRRKNRKGRA